MNRVRRLELVLGSGGLAFCVATYLLDPSVTAFFAGVFATASLTAVVVRAFVARR